MVTDCDSDNFFLTSSLLMLDFFLTTSLISKELDIITINQESGIILALITIMSSSILNCFLTIIKGRLSKKNLGM